MPSESPQYPGGNGPYAGEQPDPNPQGNTAYALRPIPENYQAEVFPYRGIQQHGVSPSRSVEPPEEMLEGGRVKIAPPDHDIAPVPVRIVQPGTKEYQQWRAFQAYAGPAPSQVVNRKENRKSLTLRNVSTTVVVWLGPDANLTKQTGYPLAPGATFSLDGEAEVWGISDDATVVLLAGFFVFGTATP